jgi:hypothetical protein
MEEKIMTIEEAKTLKVGDRVKEMHDENRYHTGKVTGVFIYPDTVSVDFILTSLFEDKNGNMIHYGMACADLEYNESENN